MSKIQIALKSDTGNWVARCNNCAPGAAYPDNAFVHIEGDAPSLPPYARFTVTKLENGKITLQADTGKYLGRCNNCLSGGAYPDNLAVHVTDANEPWAQFKPVLMPNGKYVFQADSGKYIARCNNCISGGAYPDSVFVHVTDPNEPWAQFDVFTFL